MYKMNSKSNKVRTYIYLPFFVLIAIFVISRFYPLLSKVPIKLGSIKDGASLDSGLVSITGQAKKATNLFINGKSTSVTKKGEFEESIALPSGYNIVTIEAEDKFGKRNKKTISVHVLDGDKEVQLGLK